LSFGREDKWRDTITGKLQVDAAGESPAPPGRALGRQDKLKACAERIAQSEGVPPFCGHANEVLVRTLDIEEGSSKKLVQVVLQDVGLASQVLRLANSAMYNHSGRPIMNISHAIAVLGWLEVRSMASTVRYIEHFANRSPSLRELVVSSVLTAVQSREVAAILGYPQPEEAYICGLFRNLGEVLTACHYPEEHSQIIMILADENIPERAACLRVMDLFWDDVGKSVAGLWQMPQAVRSTMDPSASGIGSPAERCLASITSYSHNLTRALYRKGAAIDAIHLETVLNPAGQATLISLRDLYLLVDLAIAETRELFSALQISIQTLRVSKQAERARKALELESKSPADRPVAQ
jgi:HD-like signal output (HDOD) protein